MILIQITNALELIRRDKGNFAATLAPFIADVEGQVEREVIAQIRAQFAKHGIEANILSVGGIDLRQITLANNWPVDEVYPDPDPDEPEEPELDDPKPGRPEAGQPFD